MGIIFYILGFLLLMNILNGRLPYILDKLYTDPITGIAIIIALVIGISIHEAAHAFTAYRLGDPTAKLAGRLTLNPAAHLDPIGTLAMIFIGVGWGKPTPFDPFNLRNIKRDSALISAAGAVSNFVLASALSIPYLIAFYSHNVTSFTNQIYIFISPIIYFNLLLGIFNLVPIAPLDGFKVLAGLLPKDWYHDFIQMERYGILILIAALFFGGFIIVARLTSVLFNFLMPGFSPPF